MKTLGLLFVTLLAACGSDNGISGDGPCAGAQLAGTATMESGGAVGCQTSFTFSNQTFENVVGGPPCTVMAQGSGGICSWTVSCEDIDASLVGSNGSLSGTWTISIPQNEGFPPATCTYGVTGYYQ